MHVVAPTVDDEGFFTVDGVPRHGPVREPNSLGLLHNSHHFDRLYNGEAQRARRNDHTVTWRHRTRGINVKPARGFYLPTEHIGCGALPNIVATSDYGCDF